MSSFDVALREQLARYVAGEITLAEFRRWFLPQIWDLAEDDQSVSPITRRVELRLAEFMNGHWSEDDLKRFFVRETPQTGSLGALLRVVLTGAIGGVPAQQAVVPHEFDFPAAAH